MAIDNITFEELKVLARNVLEGNHAIISSADNGLCARIDIWAILNELVELVDIEGCDTLRVGQIRRNANRNADFLDADIRVRSDNCTSRMFYALTL